MEYVTHPCEKCKEQVISATTARGIAVIVDPTPRLGGVWRLARRTGGITMVPLAVKATPKLSFGAHLYVLHRDTCKPVSPWAVRKS